MDEMNKIVICKSCNEPEYYGSMIWYCGHSSCRKCTYKRWERESGWTPPDKYYVFPLSENGIDFRLSTPKAKMSADEFYDIVLKKEVIY